MISPRYYFESNFAFMSLAGHVCTHCTLDVTAFDTVDRHSDTAVTSNVQCVHTCPARLMKAKFDSK